VGNKYFRKWYVLGLKIKTERVMDDGIGDDECDELTPASRGEQDKTDIDRG